MQRLRNVHTVHFFLAWASEKRKKKEKKKMTEVNSEGPRDSSSRAAGRVLAARPFPGGGGGSEKRPQGEGNRLFYVAQHLDWYK